MRPASVVLCAVLTLASRPAVAQMVMPIPDLCAGSADTVQAGQTVTLRGAVTKGCLGIHGTVWLADGVRLTVTTIYVYPDGTLTTVSDPAANIEIRIADVPPTDPEQFGTGLLCLGTCRLTGMPVTPTFSRLVGEPAAGASSLTLVTPPTAGWTNARVIVPGTTRRNPDTLAWPLQWEERTGTATGAQVALSAPLTYAHLGARDADGGLTFSPHVGNLTRSIVIRSANPAGTRGHVLASQRATVDFEYVAFVDLGRTTVAALDSTAFSSAGALTHVGTNQIGRYPLHLHHLTGPVTPQANGRQFTLVGNAIDGGSAVHTRKWGIAIHNSHYGLVRDNVVYNVAGAGIANEDGSESQNIEEHNFIVRVQSPYDGNGSERLGTNILDVGWEGSCVWSRGPLNLIRDNVSADCTSYGFKYFMYLMLNPVNVPASQGADPSVPTSVYQTPLAEFARNEAYSVDHGLTTWWLCADSFTAVAGCAPSTIKDFKVWAVNYHGYYGYGVHNLTFADWIGRGDPAFISNPYNYERGIQFADYFASNVTILKADIQNLENCIVSPTMTDGFFEIRDSRLRCTHGIVTATLGSPGTQPNGALLRPRTIRIVNTVFGPSRVGAEPSSTIDMIYSLQQGSATLTQTDTTTVARYNGVAGDDFRLFYPQQDGAFVLPQSSGNLVGCPTANLTNAQCWQQHQQAIAGAVAPCSTMRPGLNGFVCATGLPPVPVDCVLSDWSALFRRPTR